ncbi:hypothetical protein [Nostoc cycadae]|uniref:Xylose isomerase n=1 Tax=Nostoc cycadae WK-1 TaxID=1861711 RepID=A0A2H6LC69_9NOSO|nr:hypothetical protein [Nostoc cycadae]GBE90834.1 xylose isomerase [Nostoc cycadae WK-1]
MKIDKWRYGTRMQVYMRTQEEVDSYKQAAAARQMTLSQLVRTALDEYLAKAN